MGRHSTVPELFDYCKIISITKLKKWGYIKPNQSINGNIIWSRNNVETSSVHIAVKMSDEYGDLTLNYRCGGINIDYSVEIISRPANIGNGLLWFFVCPHTGAVCRKLHFGGKYFLHRSAYPDFLYELQTWSKTARYEYKTPMYLEMRADGVYDQIYRKHFKKYYNGKPTKKFVSLLKKIEKIPYCN